jgi:hypothetical protein
MNIKITRRGFVVGALKTPVIGTLAMTLGACGRVDNEEAAATASCANLDELSRSALALRESRQYTETSSNPETICAGCVYFSAAGGQPEGCGDCEILSGLVHSDGYCNVWTAKG